MNTMECADIKAMLSGLIDDEVDPETRHLAERHLADCQACRAMLDEAEALDRLVVIEAEESFDGLPAGFESAVFAKISEPPQPVMTPYAHRWTTWVGWLAAAASLALALTLWVMDRRASFPGATQGPVARIDGNDGAESGAPRRDVQPVQVRNANLISPVFDPFEDTSLYDLPESDDAYDPVVDSATAEAAEIVKEKSRELSALSDRTTISADDAQTLYNASILLEMIAEADTTSFADIEMARQILEYDELLPRLAAVRTRLDPSDRPGVLAAESILTRIVRGPIDLDDLRMLRQTVLQLKLADEVATLSDRGPRGGSA